MSHQGAVRETNEDRFLVAELSRLLLVQESNLPLEDEQRQFRRPQGYLLTVADGIGGQPGGEHASQLVVASLARYLLDSMPCLGGASRHSRCGITKQLRQSLGCCHTELVQFAREHPRLRELGTTLTTAVLLWPHLYVMHVGDSRCYVLRDREMHRLTTDHTLAQRLADAGDRRTEVSGNPDLKHMLSRALDATDKPPEADMYKVELNAGDTVMLCTDGLTGSVPEAQMVRLLESVATPEAACGALVEAAIGAAASDNITVVVGRVIPGGDGHEAA
jgi:protein phosphatase